MSSVIANASVSLDGFIADAHNQVGPLFDWFNNGAVEFNGGDPERVMHLSAASAAYIAEVWSRVGAVVMGRRLFDLTDGWRGRPAVGDAVFVVTHSPPVDWPYPDAPFTFVTDGLQAAIGAAKDFAGDRSVSVTAGDLTGQALRAGLVDELGLDVVPVVLGAGIRFFGDFAGPQFLLDNPTVIEGDRVTHLRYRVRTP